MELTSSENLARKKGTWLIWQLIFLTLSSMRTFVVGKKNKQEITIKGKKNFESRDSIEREKKAFDIAQKPPI